MIQRARTGIMPEEGTGSIPGTNLIFLFVLRNNLIFLFVCVRTTPGGSQR